MRNDDFEKLEELFIRLADKEERKGTKSLTKEQQVVLLVWHASGIIGNGGFQYLYEQSLNPELVAEAYEAIKCNACADILRKTTSVFPDGRPHEDWDARIDFIANHRNVFEKLDNAFWDADEEMVPRLADYVKKHQKSIQS